MSQVEQISDNVFVLSDVEAVDSERSWLPAHAKGFEPFNKYAIVQKDTVLLLETGVALHCESVMATLRDIVGDRMLVLMPTRSELESIGNMGAIINSFPRVQLLTTTRALPPLGLCHIRPDRRESVPARRIRRGECLDEVGFSTLQTIVPVIRILGTIWLYDRESEVLFSSDFFANDLMDTAETTTIRRDAVGLPDAATLRHSIVAKFDWLKRARTDALQAQWNSLFASIKPRTLAPSLGRVQQGRGLVDQVIDLYARALFETTS
jgi:flavorubredoxin